MNSSESMNCAAARVPFSLPSRSRASSRIRMPPEPSLVASNAACSRSCSAVSRASDALSSSSDEPASWALRASAADSGGRRVVQGRPGRRHDRRLRVRRRPGGHVRAPVPGSPVPQVPSSSHCAFASSCCGGGQRRVQLGLASRHVALHHREAGVRLPAAGHDRLRRRDPVAQRRQVGEPGVLLQAHPVGVRPLGLHLHDLGVDLLVEDLQRQRRRDDDAEDQRQPHPRDGEHQVPLQRRVVPHPDQHHPVEVDDHRPPAEPDQQRERPPHAQRHVHRERGRDRGQPAGAEQHAAQRHEAARAPGAEARTSARAPASTAMPLPIRPRRNLMQCLIGSPTSAIDRDRRRPDTGVGSWTHLTDGDAPSGARRPPDVLPDPRRGRAGR